jgi:hypothetical protein
MNRLNGTGASDRTQRLRTLETEIRAGWQQFVAIGRGLKEIRDDQLYRVVGPAAWPAQFCEGVR